jgi:hypothetical protein
MVISCVVPRLPVILVFCLKSTNSNELKLMVLKFSPLNGKTLILLISSPNLLSALTMKWKSYLKKIYITIFSI